MDNNNGSNNNKNNGNTVLLTVIGVATLLVALVGATFAYFSASINNDSNQSVSITTAAPVALVYNGSTALTIPNAKPGDTGTAKFTVTNPEFGTDGTTKNETTFKYTLTLHNDLNSFTATPNGANQLVLTVASEGLDNDLGADVTDGSGKAAAGTTAVLIEGRPIPPNTTQEYNATLTFREMSVEQNENANKSYAGHITVDDIKSVTSQQGAQN